MSARRELVFIFAAALLFFCIGLGARPYLTPSEARYIEIPRQMLVTGDWLTPRINGVPYFEKPPLFYWLQAATMNTLGMNEFAGRLMTALFSALTCAVTFVTARMLYGRLAGFLAASVFATSILGYAMSRIAVLDPAVTFFITGCIASFLAAQHHANPKHKRYFYLLMYVASALAVMTKGLIGVVIPGLVIGAWILFGKRWHILKQAQLPLGLCIFLLIAAPWHIMMARAHPEFFDFYFIHEHFARYLTSEHQRTAPWWFFIAVTFVGMLPWSGLLAIPAKAAFQRQSNDHRFLTLWIVLPLIFFSASHSKLVSYIIVIFPPLAILLSRTLAQFWTKEIPAAALRRSIAFVIIIFAVALLAYPLLPQLPGKTQRALDMVNQVPFTSLLSIIAALLGLVFILLRRRSPRTLIKGLILFGAILGLTLNFLAVTLVGGSVKPLVGQLKEHLQDGDMVVAYESYWQDLPVYLNRNITVAGWTGELDFGVAHYPETRQWMISTDEFWSRCASTKHVVYVFVDQRSLQTFLPPKTCQLQLLGFYGKTVLLEKQ